MMETIRRVWNYRVPAEKRPTVKVRALWGLAWLLAGMLCLTVISRAADAVTIPVVKTTKPTASVIVHSVSAEGILETAGDRAVMAAAENLVEMVAVAVGDAVEEGDLLFTFSTGELNRQIAQKQLELSGLQTELAAIRQNAQLADDQKALDRQRAEEDYAAALEQAELELRVAAAEVRRAKVALEKYDGFTRADFDDETYTQTEHEAFRADHQRQLIAYDKALAERDAVLQGAQRKIDDADKITVDTTASAKQTELQLKQLEVNRLYEAVATGGKVLAPADGIVTALNVKAGELTGETASAYLSSGETMLFAAQITGEDKKYVEAGNALTLKLAGDASRSYDLTVAAVQPVEGKADTYRLTAQLAAEGLVPGAGGTAVIRQQSGNFSACLPIGALYSDMGRNYVLAVRRTETSLGTEYLAERIEVLVEDRNETLAAVSGGITRDSLVITRTDRPLGDGDRVRLEGNP